MKLQLVMASIALALIGDVAVCNAQTYLWVPNYGDNTVSKINCLAHEVEATIQVGPGPGGVAAGRDRVYITHRLEPIVTVISKTSTIPHQLICKPQVGGSIPFVSSSFFKHLPTTPLLYVLSCHGFSQGSI